MQITCLCIYHKVYQVFQEQENINGEHSEPGGRRKKITAHETVVDKWQFKSFFRELEATMSEMTKEQQSSSSVVQNVTLPILVPTNCPSGENK